jgi:hypothetical protein
MCVGACGVQEAAKPGANVSSMQSLLAATAKLFASPHLTQPVPGCSQSIMELLQVGGLVQLPFLMVPNQGHLHCVPWYIPVVEC